MKKSVKICGNVWYPTGPGIPLEVQGVDHLLGHHLVDPGKGLAAAVEAACVDRHDSSRLERAFLGAVLELQHAITIYNLHSFLI